jgi:hypothetical protein
MSLNNDFIMELNNVFRYICSYNNINKDKKNIRNFKNGIKLCDAIFYKFLYTDKYTTKDSITSKINLANNNTFSRQAYNNKENNIPLNMYSQLFEHLVAFINKHFKLNKLDEIIIAVDGTNTNDNEHNIILNMGYYDVTNDLPIDITFNGAENRNKEVQCFKEYILANKEKFNNSIVVCDRLYFTYDLLSFLNDNKIKFITRIKGEGIYLDKKEPKKTDKNYQLIKKLKKEVKIYRYDNIITKVSYDTTNKRTKKFHKICFNNECALVTNLIGEDKYTKDDILNIYRSRWTIETFFKFLKKNFKCQHQIEKFNEETYQKMYYCELIISLICEIIIKLFMTTFKKIYDSKYKVSVNKSNIIKGIYDTLIYDLLKGELTKDKLELFIKSYIKVTINEKNRTFPRISKTPFSKWYIKAYSNDNKLTTIIRAHKEGKINELNKNLKMLYNRIISIDGIKLK